MSTTLDIKTFGEKLKHHRKNLSLTQEVVAERIGVSAQAVSKWEMGECLPDCFNLKALAEVYDVSLDILLKTEENDDIKAVSKKIEQLGDEFVWSKANRDAENAHRDLGNDLWEMWKGLYFIEVGNKEMQKRDYDLGSLRICSDYGMKIWDDDGVACIVKNTLKDHLDNVNEHTLQLMRELCTPEGFAIIKALDCHGRLSKNELAEKCGVEISRLNELLLLFTEGQIVEYISGNNMLYCTPNRAPGYKICAHYGIVAYMVIAMASILGKRTNFSTSEYTSYYD